jgi:hypothetical protein
MANNVTNTLTKTPELIRAFPRVVEYLLPPRFSARNYLEGKGVVPISDTTPETDVNENSSGEMYSMSIQVPICCHTVYTTSDDKTIGHIKIREPVYMHTNVPLNEIVNMARIVTADSVK